MAESGRNRADNNLISKISQLADNHITVVRNISTGLAIAGVILFARSIRLTTKFTNAKDIPSEFIKKKVKLRGKLLSITGDRLEVEHVPISLPIVASFQRKCHSQGTLFIRFAGVEMTPSGKMWLQDQLQPSQMLWFQLLNREDSVLDCFILLDRLGFFRDCLNVEILRQGLGKTVDIPGLQYDSAHYWKFYKRLLRAEVEAQKKGKGLWKQESWQSITSHRFFSTIFIQPVKRLIKLITYFWEKK